MFKTDQIRDFATKWRGKFCDQNIDYMELLDYVMVDDCESLGFKMDSGHVFAEKYGETSSNCEALDKIVDEVIDIPLLGSAIYSRWNYFKNSMDNSEEILETQNRKWFILALEQLDYLSEENPLYFQGTLEKLSIKSNDISYWQRPELDQELEQHLTINNKGQVWYKGYHYKDYNALLGKARSRDFIIEKADAEKLLGVIAEYFRKRYVRKLATDVGTWEMELTNTEGLKYHFFGSLFSNSDDEETYLSSLVRDTLRMEELLVFDGRAKLDVIEEIILDYNRVVKNPERKEIILNCKEHLIINRKTETIEHIQTYGTGFKCSHKYEIEDGIKNLIDIFDSEELFSYTEGNPDDVMDIPNETRDYKMTIKYKKKPQRILKGSFDKKGLPIDFDNFIETVFNYIFFYGVGEIFNPSVYGKIRRRKGEYIFCSVIFDDESKSYHYRTDDENIEIGDSVIVPVGNDNKETVAEVVDIKYYVEKNAPFPIEKTKEIIRKEQ